MGLEDTIAAIATPSGEGGIAIVRVSGENAIELVDKIFLPVAGGRSLQERAGYSMGLGWVLDREGQKVDEVLVSVMRGPRSYTTEDVVEINCHGGLLPARRCLEEVLHRGVRLAEPGEFTRRAFINGRLDLSQAEAVIDVIRSRTDKGMRIALRQLEGGPGRKLREIEERLIGINARIEASIDFPEEVGDVDEEAAARELLEVGRELEQILDVSRRGRIYRQGIKVVIAGKPNVGKSSLLNALLQENKAIVTDIPGTTRDVVEDYLNIRGIPVRVMDTAGWRETKDVVEKIGVERTREVIAEADVVIVVLDVGAGISQEDLDIRDLLAGKKTIVLVNKEDLPEKRITTQELEEMFGDWPVIRGSVKEDMGLEELEQAIEKLVLRGEVQADDMEMMVNLRHEEALHQAKVHMEAAKMALEADLSLDCLAVDVWGALEALGEATGRNLREDVIDRIFEEFCIGK
ncbi:MAG: tRNA uridine-5-carboxymethylaminomethyl(34) synthesis GTPase MnmE [Syntrophomonadaceae bacterium]|nr:tRNA uridine-5-carboxymethylaminomethyl(34) synthesis GTPase MnmE [Syntrophomonadaceae bacterium]